jgi:type IV fimbrial biogenesis protein FimT
MRGFYVQRGHTLAETLVAMSIVASATALAVPEMSKILASMRLRAAMSAMTSGLHLTRNEAIRRNSHVVLCKSADGTDCTRAGDWAQGWIIFFDQNHNARLDAGETVLYREASIAGNIRLWGNTPVKDYTSYTSFGRAKMVANNFQAGSFFVCARSLTSTDGYRILIDRSGTPRAEKVVLPSCT